MGLNLMQGASTFYIATKAKERARLVFVQRISGCIK